MIKELWIPIVFLLTGVSFGNEEIYVDGNRYEVYKYDFGGGYGEALGEVRTEDGAYYEIINNSLPDMPYREYETNCLFNCD
jgi:hypothetical protein